MNLVAGNLTYKIHLSQPDACGKNGVPKKMRIGNNDYYTHRFGGSNGQCWMLENSREGTPDHTLSALPGGHPRYLWNGINFASPEKIGLPAGWAAPTYTDVYNLRKATFPDGAGTGNGSYGCNGRRIRAWLPIFPLMMQTVHLFSLHRIGIGIIMAELPTNFGRATIRLGKQDNCRDWLLIYKSNRIIYPRFGRISGLLTLVCIPVP